MDGIKQAKSMVKPYQENFISRWYLGDLILAAHYLSKGQVSQAYKIAKLGSTDSYDDIHLHDPLATIGEFLYYSYKFIHHRKLNPEETGMLG